ncbi:MAG TPA: sugar phosphate nucleotidyltransferase, partial [Clostridiales bacterium]|nr:sugar phosphate nucleotidyltransferase [Clostridiales bacterium]
VYIFTWSKLRQYLIDDEADPNSSNDFGKDVIPKMHRAGERMYAYEFDGYWKDVGTIDSLWEANLDLLNPQINIDLDDASWKIYSRNAAAPPHYISADSKVENSLVSAGCEIEGEIDYSVLFSNVTVEKGACVKYSIIMPGAVIKEGAVVQYSIVAENAVIESGAVVGEKPESMKDPSAWGVAVVGAGVTIGKGVTVPSKAMIDKDMKGGN